MKYRKFINVQNKVVNPLRYARDVLRNNPDITLYVGSDSQNRRRFTTFATVIAFRNGSRGTHFIFSREHVKPRMRSVEHRLMEEWRRTVDVANWLMQNGIRVDCVEFDANRDSRWGSNRIIDVAVSYAYTADEARVAEITRLNSEIDDKNDELILNQTEREDVINSVRRPTDDSSVSLTTFRKRMSNDVREHYDKLVNDVTLIESEIETLKLILNSFGVSSVKYSLKPDEMVASKAADHLVRKGGLRNYIGYNPYKTESELDNIVSAE